jgi:membrane-associated phospholipid phosphatase
VTAVAEPPVRTVADRLARATTEVFDPAIWAAGMPLIIAVAATAPAWLVGLGWGLLAVLFCSVIPYGIIWLGVRCGKLTDHHIGVREQRRTPLLYGLLSVLAGVAILTLGKAPRALIAMVLVMFAVLLVVTAINQAWKLSAHAAVAAGSAAVLTIEFGPALLTVMTIVALVGWSRVRLKDHTAAQVTAGTIAGILIAIPTYLGLT